MNAVAQPTIEQTLRAGIRALAADSASPRLDAELLLANLLGLPRSGLLARGEQPLSSDACHQYDALLTRRRAGVPVAYLTGTREFWSLRLSVTPAVLVPRPETETLVEAALARLPAEGVPAVLDLGTGSGAIALAIASERPNARITAVDLSSEALRVARSNAAALGLDAVQWRQGSWFEALANAGQSDARTGAAGARFDVIVSNPPYVASGDPALDALHAEPLQALTCGPTGFESLEHIITNAVSHLSAGGWLLLEHGSTQAAQVADCLVRSGFTQIQSLADAAGLPRVTLGSVQHQEKDCL